MNAEKTTILLVEDSPTQALHLRHALEQEGYRVTHVRSGEEALTTARASPPQLIISDVMMPEMSGYELCEAVKSDKSLNAIPLMLLTALDTPVSVIHGLQVRAERYLIKSTDPTQLLAAVRELLSPAPAEDASNGTAPLEVVVDGQRFRINASREQIVRLLLSTYESAVQNNHELLLARTALQRQQEELEQKVRERTLALTSANDDLQKTTARLQENENMRSEFILNVSHELRTPLTSMSCAISNLMKGILGPLPEKFQPYLTMLAQECERLKGTVTSILDVTRIDARTMVLRHMKVPFAAWVRRATAELHRQAAAKQVSLVITDPEAPGFVDADPLKLQRVMLSVIQNAIQYSPPEGRVDIGVAPIRGGTWMETSITDEGPGIPPEHLPRLTDRYYRVGEFVSGTGLGLNLCKEILGLMGGEIELLSPPPGKAQGTRALIRLPLTSAPTVLAVDDSRSIQMLLEQHLRLHGYAVVSCGSPEQALKLMTTSKPDLLISDSVMPGMDGTDLVVRIKSDYTLRHVPIIMITGAEIAGENRKILEEFRIPVLGKPWAEAKLISCIEDAIYGKHYLER